MDEEGNKRHTVHIPVQEQDHQKQTEHTHYLFELGTRNAKDRNYDRKMH